MSTVRTAALETEEHQALRAAVAALGKRYGREYMTTVIREGSHTRELWLEAAKLGYLGVNLPEEYGGGAVAWPNSPSSWRSWGRPVRRS